MQVVAYTYARMAHLQLPYTERGGAGRQAGRDDMCRKQHCAGPHPSPHTYTHTPTQVLSTINDIFEEEGLSDRLFLRPYTILCAGPKAGLIEDIADARSIDHLKKR